MLLSSKKTISERPKRIPVSVSAVYFSDHHFLLISVSQSYRHEKRAVRHDELTFASGRIPAFCTDLKSGARIKAARAFVLLIHAQPEARILLQLQRVIEQASPDPFSPRIFPHEQAGDEIALQADAPISRAVCAFMHIALCLCQLSVDRMALPMPVGSRDEIVRAEVALQPDLRDLIQL